MMNEWVVGVGSTLLATALIVGVKQLWKNTYPVGLALFSVVVATVVFLIGNVLEPAVQGVIEGFDYLRCIKNASDPLCVFPVIGVYGWLLMGGLVPGIIVGLGILGAQSLQQRMVHGSLLSVLTLAVWDLVGDYIRYASFPFQNFYFSIFSDLVGGLFAGAAIGAAVHAFAQVTASGATRATRA